MNKWGWIFLATAAVGVIAVAVYDRPATVAPAPAPAPPPCPDGKCPPRKPWGDRPAPAREAEKWRVDGVDFRAGAVISGPIFPDGTEIQCDYPGDRHRRNTASHGLGLCVFTSIHHAADWQDIPTLLEMPKWLIDSGIPGGGYPSKVTQLIARLSKERGASVPDYFQIEASADEAFPLLRAATRSGRMVCITYYRSPTGRYGGSRISHMVNLPHLCEKWAAVLDNNYPGADKYEVMSPAELRSAACGSDGRLWAIVFAAPGPPPVPHHGGTVTMSPAPAWEKACPCSPRCSCGCNEGKPCRCSPPTDTAGVVSSELSKAPRYRRAGKDVDREEVLDALMATGVPDDVKKWRVVVIGPKTATAKVVADWRSHPSLAPLHAGYVLQAYAPDHWHVKGMGYVTDRTPAIHVLEPDGKSRGWIDGYDGPEGLATTLRKRRPDYDAKNDRGETPLSGVPVLPLAAVGAAGAGAFYLARRQPR